MAPVGLVAVRAGLTRMVKVAARAVVFTAAAAAVVTLLRGEWELVALVWWRHRAAAHVVVAHCWPTCFAGCAGGFYKVAC